LKSKILICSIGYYFVLFILLAFLTSFFLILLIQSCQKIIKNFMVLYYTEYRFYRRSLENSWIFIEKNIDIWNTKHFQNSIVYYLLFYFLVFLTFFFLFYLPIVVKKFLKFLCFLLYGYEILSKNSRKLRFFFKEMLIYLKSKISPKHFQNYFTYLYFFKRPSRNFQNSLIKSLILPIKQYKKFQNFLTSLDRWNRKKDVKNAKKMKKKL